MAPITLQRLIKQLDKLKPEADAARLKTHDYARWLARMIRRLRERSFDADRAAATAALAEALKRGAITAPMEANPHKRPGKRRFIRYSPLGSKSTDAALADLTERQLLAFFRQSQPAWTSPEGGYGVR